MIIVTNPDAEDKVGFVLDFEHQPINQLSEFMRTEKTARYTKCIISQLPKPDEEGKFRMDKAVPIGEGKATCSKHDNYVRFIGRKIALSRAMKAARLSKEERTKIWMEYLSKVRFPKQS